MGSGRVIIFGDVRNGSSNAYERVTLLAEGLDEAGAVVSRGRAYVAGLVPARGSSPFECRLSSGGRERRFRVTVEAFQIVRAKPLTGSAWPAGARPSPSRASRPAPSRPPLGPARGGGARPAHRPRAGAGRPQRRAPAVKLEGALEVLFGAYAEGDPHFSEPSSRAGRARGTTSSSA